MTSVLPERVALEFLEDRAVRSVHAEVRGEALRVLLTSGTIEGVRAVLRRMSQDRGSRPPWAWWRDFGVPMQLHLLGKEAVILLELHGKLILAEMGSSGYPATRAEADAFCDLLQRIGSADARAAELRFRSSVSWHKKRSPGPAAPASATAPDPKAVPPHPGFEVLFGRRTVARLGGRARGANELPAFLAPEFEALRALPETMSRCEFTCLHAIPSHPRPGADVVGAWGAALGTDLERALCGTPARRVLQVVETGELVLHVFWERNVSRMEVMSVCAMMKRFLPSIDDPAESESGERSQPPPSTPPGG